MPNDRHDPFEVLELAASRQSAEQAAARALSAARVKLILGRDAKSAFFATLALRLNPEPGWDLETMSTDGRVLRYCPKFVQELSSDELVGVLAHEVMHCALAHPHRRGMREHTRWNIACDLAINPILRDSGFVLPSGRLMPGEGDHANLELGHSAEEYYSALANDAPVPESQSPDSGTGSGSPDSEGEAGDPGGCGQVIDPGSPADGRQQEAEWQVAVAQARQAASGRGELPGGLGRSVERVLHPPADWRSVLRTFVSMHAKNDYYWVRPNRRFIAQGLYLPGLHSEELGDVVLAVDTSGSIDEKLLGVFSAEVNAVLGAYDCAVTVLYHDNAIQKVQSWHSSDGPLVLEPAGGGGTSHVCVFDWLNQSNLNPACVICLTDLETEFPDSPPAVPVLWAAVGDASAPFGQVVPISL